MIGSNTDTDMKVTQLSTTAKNLGLVMNRYKKHLNLKVEVILIVV